MPGAPPNICFVRDASNSELSFEIFDVAQSDHVENAKCLLLNWYKIDVGIL